MRYFLEFSDEAAKLAAEYQACVSQLFSSIDAADEGATITADTDVISAPALAGKLFVIRDGYFTYKVDDRRVLFFETGDLVGLDSVAGIHTGSISSPFPVRVDVYDYKSLKAAVASNDSIQDSWNKLLVTYSALLRSLVAAATEGQVHFTPEERLVRADQVIIEEGSSGEEVYSLVSGKLDVISGGAKVGEILEGELFGVIASLTNTPRTATVKAVKDSIILAVPGEKFVELVRCRPATLGKLLESFARILGGSNRAALRSAVEGVSGLKAG